MMNEANTKQGDEAMAITPISEQTEGWGPIYDVTDWSYVDFSDIRDAFVYTQDGKMLLEFPKHVRTAHVQEDIDELLSSE